MTFGAEASRTQRLDVGPRRQPMRLRGAHSELSVSLHVIRRWQRAVSLMEEMSKSQVESQEHLL